MSAELTVIGVPTSAGAHHAGQDLAPEALRRHGFVERLEQGGLPVTDAGDLPGSVFRVDPGRTSSRNLEAVLAVAEGVADAVAEQVRNGRIPIVLGGDCTITLGVVAGMKRAGRDVGVAYLDGDADLGSAGHGSGILDATGVAHLLGIADTPLATLAAPSPLLRPDQLVLLGYDRTDIDSVDEGALADRPGLLRFTDADLAADPQCCVRRAADRLADREAVHVHFDVDSIDSGDLPLANFPHYGTGVSFETAMLALEGLLRMPNLASVALTEVNPTHDPVGEQLERYVEGVVTAILCARC